MKKKKIIKALQNHCRLMAKDFDERMQKLQKENSELKEILRRTKIK